MSDSGKSKRISAVSYSHTRLKPKPTTSFRNLEGEKKKETKRKEQFVNEISGSRKGEH